MNKILMIKLNNKYIANQRIKILSISPSFFHNHNEYHLQCIPHTKTIYICIDYKLINLDQF